ncbi:hypothetical protein Q7C36_014973 [Tachysurus vachellii]|uniref:Uncharacterized protein n=1 Tax=Tachysurus vachellii TaxID=175792 RepID=A0AA88MAM6_TACVA|nr:hypothetical protein Q7C36_014973 [Tachysurus vachellii]
MAAGGSTKNCGTRRTMKSGPTQMMEGDQVTAARSRFSHPQDSNTAAQHLISRSSPRSLPVYGSSRALAKNAVQ